MPTLSLESLLCTLIVDAKKGRTVATFNAPVVYLHEDMHKDKMTLMNPREDFVDIMCHIKP